MNKLLEQCLIIKAQNDGLREGISALQEEIKKNQSSLNDFVYEYVNKHFPNKIAGMICPRDKNDEPFNVYNIVTEPFEDSVSSFEHKGIICFHYLIDYEYNESYGDVIPDPVYKSGFVYLEELKENA